MHAAMTFFLAGAGAAGAYRRPGVVRADAQLSDDYFDARPAASQLGAWASPQPAHSHRSELENRLRDVTERFARRQPPRP